MANSFNFWCFPWSIFVEAALTFCPFPFYCGDDILNQRPGMPHVILNILSQNLAKFVHFMYLDV